MATGVPSRQKGQTGMKMRRLKMLVAQPGIK
jgi:hypothetical protein